MTSPQDHRRLRADRQTGNGGLGAIDLRELTTATLDSGYRGLGRIPLTTAEAVTGDLWPLNVGQVYTTLQRLERDGLVESDDAGEEERQKRYRLTAQGKAELMQQWTRAKEDEVEFDLPFALVVDAELTWLGAAVQWLDIADRHVKRAGKEPVRTSVPKLRRRVVVRQ